jgi:amidase
LPSKPEVSEGVLSAISTLERLGAEVTRISVPEHAQVDVPYAALVYEGARAVFDVGFYGVGAKTYYPASIITAIERMWRDHGDLMPPRTKLNHLVAEISRRTYHGRVYAKAQNVRPTFVAAFDKALAKVDVLALPTARMIAPLVEEDPTDPKEIIEAGIRRNWMMTTTACNTKPTNYTGHPALAVPCGKVYGMPISLQLIGKHLADPLLLRVAYAFQKEIDWEAITGIRRHILLRRQARVARRCLSLTRSWIGLCVAAMSAETSLHFVNLLVHQHEVAGAAKYRQIVRSVKAWPITGTGRASPSRL